MILISKMVVISGLLGDLASEASLFQLRVVAECLPCKARSRNAQSQKTQQVLCLSYFEMLLYLAFFVALGCPSSRKHAPERGKNRKPRRTMCLVPFVKLASFEFRGPG